MPKRAPDIANKRLGRKRIKPLLADDFYAYNLKIKSESF